MTVMMTATRRGIFGYAPIIGVIGVSPMAALAQVGAGMVQSDRVACIIADITADLIQQMTSGDLCADIPEPRPTLAATETGRRQRPTTRRQIAVWTAM